MTPALPGETARDAKGRLIHTFESGLILHLENEMQRELFRAVLGPNRYIAMTCGWGAGKTAGLVIAALLLAAQRPGETFYFVTDTVERWRDVVEPEMRKFLGGSGWRHRPSVREWSDPQTGTTIKGKTWVSHSTRSAEHNSLEGLNGGALFIDEAQTLPRDAVLRGIGRLRGGERVTVVMGGLPMYGGGEWWHDWATEKGGVAITSSTLVNPALPDDYLEALKDLPESLYQAMVLGNPQPPEGLVYDFRPEPWPAGNLTPAGWGPPPDSTFRLAADFGLRKPSVLIICEDDELGDVVVADIEPREVTVGQLAREVLKVAWPAEDSRIPADRIPIHKGCGDKAGRARNDQTLRSTFDILRQPPPDGLGLALKSPRGSQRTDVMNGVRLMQSLISQRRWLVESRLWWRLVRDKGNNIAHALMRYTWDGDDDLKPKKDGLEDPCDAARYDLVTWRWRADRPAPPSKPRSTPVRERKPRTRGVRRGGRIRGKL